MWCGFPMKITRCGYAKLIQQLKAKMAKRNEERTKMEKCHEGNDLYLSTAYQVIDRNCQL